MKSDLYERLARHADFGADDLARLKDVHSRLATRLPLVVTDFYERLVTDEATRSIFEDERQLERLKLSFRRWLDELFLSERDDGWRRARDEIGRAHVRVGLPPAYVFTAMSHVRRRIEETIDVNAELDACSKDLVKASLGKALDLELAMISEAYHEADKYRDIVEAAPEMIHATDASGRFVLVNQTEVDRLGYSRDRLLSLQLEDIVHPEDRAVARAHLAEVLATGASRCELRLVTSSGSVIVAEVLATAELELVTRSFQQARAYVRDITARRRIEEALKKEREIEKRFLEVAGVMILMLGADGRVRLINRKGAELLGRRETEIVGRDWFELAIAPEDRAAVRALFDETVVPPRAGPGWQEHHIVAADGTKRLIEWKNSVLLAPDGSVSSTLSSGLDVTDNRRMIRELLEKKSLARLGEMAAVVAHEVRNPLAGFHGALQVIAEHLDEDSSDRDIIKEILVRIDALNATIADLLLFARPRMPRKSPVSLCTLINETIAFLTRDAALEHVTIRTEVDDDSISCDVEQMKAVLHNLLANAAQAAVRGVIDVRASLTADSASISVRDHGPGIPKDLRERIFEPFFTTKNRGTGLGLAIARRLIEIHGGTLELRSPQDGGAEFRITLPVAVT